MKKLLFILLIFSMFVQPIHAYKKPPNYPYIKHFIQIVDDSRDITGSTLATMIQDTLVSSGEFFIVDSNCRNRYDLIITTSEYSSVLESVTFYSVVLNCVVNYDSYFVDSVLGYTSISNAKQTAEELARFIEEGIKRNNNR